MHEGARRRPPITALGGGKQLEDNTDYSQKNNKNHSRKDNKNHSRKDNKNHPRKIISTIPECFYRESRLKKEAETPDYKFRGWEDAETPDYSSRGWKNTKTPDYKFRGWGK